MKNSPETKDQSPEPILDPGHETLDWYFSGPWTRDSGLESLWTLDTGLWAGIPLDPGHWTLD